MKKQKSLRQLAKELGVSHSYLSQVRHGKRPASEKVVSKMVSKSEANSGLKIRRSNPCGFESHSRHQLKPLNILLNTFWFSFPCVTEE
ncbi:helix-turn-helix domain-containing protein [Chloroflexota bacterium]